MKNIFIAVLFLAIGVAYVLGARKCTQLENAACEERAAVLEQKLQDQESARRADSLKIVELSLRLDTLAQNAPVNEGIPLVGKIALKRDSVFAEFLKGNLVPKAPETGDEPQ